MKHSPPSYLAEAHHHFSAFCFNQAWTLLCRTTRTPEEDRLMVALSMASVYHWTQRPDCSDQNLSVGYWQVSRVYVTLKRATEALYFAEICLEYSEHLTPFYRGYAFEAIARAAALAGKTTRAESARHKPSPCSTK